MYQADRKHCAPWRHPIALRAERVEVIRLDERHATARAVQVAHYRPDDAMTRVSLTHISSRQRQDGEPAFFV